MDKEIEFIDAFSNSDIDTSNVPPKIELPICSKFLNNDIGIKYIGNMLKSIDIRLYLVYLKMLKDNIKFSNDYNAEESVCVSSVLFGVTRDVKLNVPYMRNGMDILVNAHELGHGIKSFIKVNNDRHLHSNTIFDETVSILFGGICLDRYINDFGNDLDSEQFDALNVRNALNCLKKAKELLPEYLRKKEVLDRTTPKLIKNPKYDDYKFQSFVRDVEEMRCELYKLISYPVGIALLNVYDNFDESQKEEYLELITKFLLNIKHIDFQMILDYFNIPFDAEFFIKNFKEYVSKFNGACGKKLIYGGDCNG